MICIGGLRPPEPVDVLDSRFTLDQIFRYMRYDAKALDNATWRAALQHYVQTLAASVAQRGDIPTPTADEIET